VADQMSEMRKEQVVEEEGERSVGLTRLEIAGALAAVRAVADSAPGGPPSVLLSAADKLHKALRESSDA
jgi:hypothetical protein